MTDRTLDLARRLHALARTGLHFCANEYDRERYAQVEEIAQMKMVDLNARSLEAACRIIEGTARSCGIEVKG